MQKNRFHRVLSFALALMLLLGLSTTALATEPIPVQSIELSPPAITLRTGGHDTLTAAISPADATDQRVTWGSSDEAVATVNDRGVVTAVAAGTATITATTVDGGHIGFCTVTVIGQTSIKLDKNTLTILRDDTARLSATVSPSGTAVTWSSSNSSVASVSSNGTVTAKAVGTAVITASLPGGQSDRCTVTVMQPDPSLSPSAKELKISETVTLSLRDLPEGARVSWSVDKPSVAAITESSTDSCKVEALSAGVARITATVTGGGDVFTAACKITVSSNTNAALSTRSLSLTTGKKSTLTVSGLPTDGSVSWESSKPSVATVSDAGVVTAVAKGSATITATVKNSAGSTVATLTCSVTVTTGAISYSVEAGEPVRFKVSDFTTVCKSYTDETLDFVRFTLPSSSDGRLYLMYGESGQKAVSPSISYYRNTSPELADISFVPDKSASGTVSVAYTGRSTGGKTFSGTVEIKVSARNTDPRVSYETDRGEEVIFKASDFNTACRNETGANLDHVRFTLPDSDDGKLYYKYDRSGEKSVSSSTEYYRDSDPSLDDVTFVPTKNASGTVVIKFTAWSTEDDKFTGTVRITINDDRTADDEIAYETTENEPVTLKASDFNEVCKDMTGSTLNYVRFSQPNASHGKLWYKYDESAQKFISTSTNYYRSGDPALGDVTFVPAEDYTGTASISFTAYNADGKHFTGTLKIKVRAGTAGDDLTYEIEKNETLAFDTADFNSFCKEETGEALDYIRFSLPSSGKGKLWYKYDESGESAVSTSTSYYRSSSPRLDDVSFVPAKNYTGTVTIKFTGYSTDDDKISGEITIQVGYEADDDEIIYETDKNEPVSFKASDFNALCDDETDETLDYVRFTLPSADKGKLWLKYDESGEKAVTASTSYYRSESPALSDISFVPAKDYTGSVSISFTGRSADGDDFSGKVTVRVGMDTASSNITYKASKNAIVKFNDTDFSSICKEKTGETLDYVCFTLPKSGVGKLWHNFGTNEETSISSSTKCHRSGSPELDEISFVPVNGLTGTVTIEFVGYSTEEDRFSGTVTINYGDSVTGSTIRYATDGTAVTFNSRDFTAAFEALGGDELDSVRFNLPDSAMGRLYLNYDSPNDHDGRISKKTDCYVSASPQIGKISFVPKAGFSGTVTINYTATDKNDDTFDGKILIEVTQSTATNRFKDMNSHPWAVSSVNFLSVYGVTNGLTKDTYAPAGSISRGDFVLMLYRAFELKGGSGSGFADVPAGSYYADAIAAAKALGIAQGSDGRFNPTAALTRQDAMVLISRTLAAVDLSVDEASASYLKGFSDGAQVAAYAQDAVAALAQAGIIQGSNGKLNPNSSLTRAEMAVILHRVLTM